MILFSSSGMRGPERPTACTGPPSLETAELPLELSAAGAGQKAACKVGGETGRWGKRYLGEMGSGSMWVSVRGEGMREGEIVAQGGTASC